jgi:(2Fe-2S) ferredoxin
MNNSKLVEAAAQVKIGQYTRHVFLCIGDSCCSKEEGEQAWMALKNDLKEKNLSLSDGPSACYRTKTGCMRICMQGPILVVYPEGHWYCNMTADRMSEFVDRQIIKGEAIQEWIFARNPLSIESGLSD